MLEAFFAWFNAFVNGFLNAAGNNPFAAMWFLFTHGGWILFLWVILYGIQYGWLYRLQGKAITKKEWVLLRIVVPRSSEQTPRATENLFAYLAGAHSSLSWTDTWIRGSVQAPISLEVASIGGRIHYYAHVERKMRDLIEAAIYAQYPDAEIHEAQDYAVNVPSYYPDEEWDMWGTEMINVKPDPYPLRTYHDFLDKVSGEFKDPLSAMLEGFARLGQDEQAWYQIVLTPTDQKATIERATALMKKLRGEDDPKNVDKNGFPKLFALSPGEREVLEAVEHKAGKIGFQTKIRFVYVAKKTSMQKARAVNPFIGAMKQMNTFNMQAIKPDLKSVGMSSSIWWFKDKRNDGRKRRLMMAYRYRSNWAGMKAYNLSTEELATLWHFPILSQVKAPQLHRTEAKKTDAPSNVPFVS